ncbi:MAG: hypothetical protein U0838_10165 [Chloroflexota bacterium]
MLHLDGAQANALDVGFGEEPADEPGKGQRAVHVRAAGAALRPAAVVGADVDPGEHDLAMAGGEGASDVGQHGFGRE